MKSSNQRKFENPNFFQGPLIRLFQKRFIGVLKKIQPRSVLEVGCGEGFLQRAIVDAFPSISVLGLDVNDQALAEGKRLFPNLSFEHGDIFRIPKHDASWDVVVASEILEHLDDPRAALRELRRVSAHWVLLSVPHEPWFRIGHLGCGHHIRSLGNHPEHINQWSRRAFASLVREFLVVERVTGSFPWTIVLARR
jgi:SAM-dependent methyltransferase